MQGNRDKSPGNMQVSTKTILLVEDDIAIAELLVQLIAQETPYRIFEVSDGPQALNIVKGIKPDLLLLDYWLPSIFGIELYDRLCAAEGRTQIPTIMLSVNAPLQEIKKRNITYVKKPFDLFKLLDIINARLV